MPHTLRSFLDSIDNRMLHIHDKRNTNGIKAQVFH